MAASEKERIFQHLEASNVGECSILILKYLLWQKEEPERNKLTGWVGRKEGKNVSGILSENFLLNFSLPLRHRPCSSFMKLWEHIIKIRNFVKNRFKDFLQSIHWWTLCFETSECRGKHSSLAKENRLGICVLLQDKNRWWLLSAVSAFSAQTFSSSSTPTHNAMLHTHPMPQKASFWLSFFLLKRERFSFCFSSSKIQFSHERALSDRFWGCFNMFYLFKRFARQELPFYSNLAFVLHA